MPAPRETGRGPVFAVVLAALFLALASPVLAQTTLSGIVHDPNGRVAPAVPLVAERLGDGDVADARWETISTDIGYYEFTKLPPGHYRITIELPPFRPVTADVTVQTQRRAVLDIALRLGSDERVTVQGNASPRPLGAVELSGVATVAQFSRTELDTLPLTNGRTVQSVQLLVPGLLVTDSVGTLAQFTAVGQRRFANRMTIDGVSADLGVDVRGVGIAEGGSGTLPAFATSGGTQTLVPMDAVDQIEVRTTNAAPEFARTPGAQTAVVTRAGGDRLMGTGFLSNRPNALTASDWFANAGQAPRRTLDYWNAAVSAGGPAIPGRLFYFGTWEGQRGNRPLHTTIDVPSATARASASPALRPILDAFPQPNGPEREGDFAAYTHAFPLASALSAFSVRVDGTIDAQHRMFVRLNRGRSNGEALGSDVPVPFYSYANREDASTDTATTGLTSVVSGAFINDLRVNVSRHHGALVAAPAGYGAAQPLPDSLTSAAAADNAWVYVWFPGEATSVASGRNADSSQTQLEFSDTLSYGRGRHQWRLGLDYTQVTTGTDAAANRYLYRFGSLDDLLQGRARQLNVSRVLPAKALRQTWAAFVQDTIRVGSRLTLDLGLRYRVQPAPTNRADVQPFLIRYDTLPDLEARPAGSRLWDTAWTNLAPHIGATFQLDTTSGRERLLRLSWSRVFDDLASPGISALTRSAPFVSTRTFTRPTVPLAASDLAAGAPAPFSPGDASEYFAFPSDLRTPRTSNWQVGIEQALGGSQRVSVAYVGAAARDLLYWHAYYAGAPVVHAYSNDGRSDYHALLGEYVRRLSRGFEARAVYTWSHAIDTDSGESLTPNPPPSLIAPAENRASADFDRRHALQFSASYQVPTFTQLPMPLQRLTAGWQIGVVGMLRSGAPLTVTTVGVVDGWSYTLRPDLVPGQPLWIPDPTSATGQRINAAAFSEIPPEDRQGTSGRNALRSSWLRQIDLSVSRNLRLGGRMTALLRVEAFNVFNLPNFGTPLGLQMVNGFGAPFQSYADSLGSGTLSRGGLVPIQQVGGPRSIQISARLGF